MSFGAKMLRRYLIDSGEINKGDIFDRMLTKPYRYGKIIYDSIKL